jgi:hypothetical protein
MLWFMWCVCPIRAAAKLQRETLGTDSAIPCEFPRNWCYQLVVGTRKSHSRIPWSSEFTNLILMSLPSSSLVERCTLPFFSYEFSSYLYCHRLLANTGQWQILFMHVHWCPNLITWSQNEHSGQSLVSTTLPMASLEWNPFWNLAQETYWHQHGIILSLARYRPS